MASRLTLGSLRRTEGRIANRLNSAALNAFSSTQSLPASVLRKNAPHTISWATIVARALLRLVPIGARGPARVRRVERGGRGVAEFFPKDTTPRALTGTRYRRNSLPQRGEERAKELVTCDKAIYQQEPAA